jgi:hypothetical protein
MTSERAYDAHTLTVSIPATLAEHLAFCRSLNFAESQPGRFLPLDDTCAAADATDFRGGTLMWTESTADAVLLHSLERQAGYAVALLCDEFGDEGFCGRIVVLSSRPAETLY